MSIMSTSMRMGVLCLLVALSSAQNCQVNVQEPCECSESLYDGLGILCDGRGASSLNEVLNAIAGVRDRQIDSLTIRNVPLRQLPADAFRQFTIIRLVLNNNQLSILNDRAFDGTMLDSLLELDMKNNALGTVPQTALPKLRKLRKLYLAKNNIFALPANSFSNWESRDFLIKLDLSDNNIDEAGYRNADQAFRPLRNLEELSLEANALNSLQLATSALTIQKNTLTNLNIGLNNIAEVPINALDFTKLESLSLEFNTISYIQATAFRGVPSLKYLYLTGNKFTEWDKDMYEYLGDLQILGIGETAISYIPSDAFIHMPRLARLEMSQAAVDRIDRDTFQKCPLMQAIIMNGNRLQAVPDWMFSGLNELYSVDLQANQLTVIADSAFASLPGMRHLDISNNRLQTLSRNTFQNSFQATADSRVLYVCGNPWACFDGLAWFRQWLRANDDIQIDKFPACTSVCTTAPDWFRKDLPLKSLDPPRPATTTAAPQPVIRVARSSVDLGWIILAVIMSILLISICLLAIARYFTSRKHKQEKEEIIEDDNAKLAAGSIAAQSVVDAGAYSQSPYSQSPYPVYASAGYPSSFVDLDLPPATSLDYDRDRYFAY